VTATLSIVMVNAVRRGELVGYDSDGFQGQKRLWLLLSYLVSFGALGWAVAGLVAFFAKPGHDAWTGAVRALSRCRALGCALVTKLALRPRHVFCQAGVAQCVLIVASGLTYWVTRGPHEQAGF
jgi:hypothetical protein